MMPVDYPDLMQANTGLLVEACSIMSAAGVEFVVVGGWVAFLRSAGNALRHPGTSDVDLLFRGDIGRMKDALPRFWDAGYVPSAKHPFQLLKKLSAGKREFVFNVDLMHPAEAGIGIEEEMFHDIMDLGVRRFEELPETEKMKSIAFLSADVIFDSRLWSDFSIDAVLPDGTRRILRVPLMNEQGLVLSKCESVKGIKRGRDAFDIYFVLSGPNGDQIAKALKQLASQNPGAAEQLAKLRKFAEEYPDAINARVAKYARGAKLPDCAGFIARALT